MAAARYWRLVGVETYAGGDLELSALHLYGQSVRVDQAATLTCSHAPIAGTLANLQDDDTATVCRFAGAAVRSSGFALQWDFGASPADVLAVIPGSAATAELFMAACALQNSDDAVSWAQVSLFGRYPWPGANTMIAHSAAGDPAFENVSALLHFDGAEDSTTVIDDGPSPKTFAAYGGAKISTSQSMFGGAALTLNGSTDYVQCLASADFAFPGDFTIEFWALKNADGSGGYDNVATTDTSNGSAINGWFLELSNSRGVSMWSNGNKVIEVAVNPNDDVWHHWAVARSGNTVRAFKEGLVIATSTFADAIAADGVFGIGGSSISTSYRFNGIIDDLRITKGVARYTANFSPPASAFQNFGGGGGGMVFDLAIMHSLRSAISIAASAPVPAHTTASAPRLQLARDVEVGGQGTIYGTTKTAGAQGAPSTPTKARVVLLHQRSKLPVRETWSDPVTGNYAFHGIDTRQQFLVLAEDAQGNFRPVAANRLTPEVQP